MATHKSFSRKDLKTPDAFQQVSGQVVSGFARYRTPVLAGLLGFIVLIGAIGFIQQNASKAALKQEQLYFEMVKLQEKDKSGVNSGTLKQMNDKLPDFEEGFQKQRAKLLMADAYYSARKFDEAQALYSELLGAPETSAINKNLAKLGSAYIHEAKKEYGKAVEVLKSLIDSPGQFPLFYVYLGLARCQDLEGDSKSAVLVLRDMQTRFPEHGDLAKVQAMLNRLEAKA